MKKLLIALILCIPLSAHAEQPPSDIQKYYEQKNEENRQALVNALIESNKAQINALLESFKALEAEVEALKKR